MADSTATRTPDPAPTPERRRVPRTDRASLDLTAARMRWVAEKGVNECEREYACRWLAAYGHTHGEAD